MADLVDVVVIGGGIVGVSTAYELSRLNYRVALLTKHSIGDPDSASARGFAWINATSKLEDEPYHHFNAAGVSYYNHLARLFKTEDIGLQIGGSLRWTHSGDTSGYENQLKIGTVLNEFGYPAIKLNRSEMTALERNIDFQDNPEGLFMPQDRWLDSPLFLNKLKSAAAEMGCEFRENCAVSSFSRSSDGSVSSVVTSAGRITTRFLVVCAGLNTPKILGQIDGSVSNFAPVNPSPGLLVETESVSNSPLISRVLYPPDSGGLHIRPAGNGGIVIGAEDIDSQLPAGTDSPPPEMAENLLDRTQIFLNKIDKLRRDNKFTARICVRPIPKDDRPIIGELPGVPNTFLSVMHSGITLGPLAGRLLTELIHTGKVPETIASYSPSRFAVKSL